MADPLNPDEDLIEQARLWVVRLASTEMSEEDLEQLDDWLAQDGRHAEAFGRERALWQDLGEMGQAMRVEDEAPAQPSVAVLPVGGMGWLRRTVRAVPLALAACLVAMLFGPQVVVALRADYRTGAGEIRAVTLADGTRAQLDSNSAIAVDFTGRDRMVHLLAGRAWFDVAHERRPFIVEAMGGRTVDIGTAFEVRRNADSVETGVTQGAVRVQMGDGPAATGASLLLKAGQRSRYAAQGMERLAAQSPDDVAAWRHGELQLDGMPMEAALAEVARYRRAPIFTLGSFASVPPASGLFLTARPDEALETIAQMRGLAILTLPGGIIVVRPQTTR